MAKHTMSNPAETYESYITRALFAPWASYMVKAANPQSGERTLREVTEDDQVVIPFHAQIARAERGTT